LIKIDVEGQKKLSDKICITNKKLSVVIPVLNEEHNLELLYTKIKATIMKMNIDSEIIFVDDGSTDKSFQTLLTITQQDKSVKIIKFKKNFGQTAAMMAGIRFAQGEVIVTMDGDLQNDPTDIPALISKLEEGFDLVCGWRKNRMDPFWRRKVPSWFANILISKFSGVHLHDYGCTLKAFDAESIKGLTLYGEMHRFIPAMIAREGGRVTELSVNHHHRQHGKSKYGLERIFKVLFDLFVLKFMSGYTTRPIYFFGFFSLLTIAFGSLIGLYTLYQRFVTGILGVNLLSLVLLTMMFLLFGGQTLLFGLLAEISIRNYYIAHKTSTYKIEKIINGDDC
jgi:glycosyltransferase involved in cell wall biosynthesis